MAASFSLLDALLGTYVVACYCYFPAQSDLVGDVYHVEIFVTYGVLVLDSVEEHTQVAKTQIQSRFPLGASIGSSSRTKPSPAMRQMLWVLGFPRLDPNIALIGVGASRRPVFSASFVA